jgi:hypothetical protein
MLRYRELVIFVALACLFSCGGGETQAIKTFMSAVQAGDEAAQAAVSTVDFPGEVGTWEIVEVSPETTVPCQLPELREKLRAANQDVDYHAQKFGNFLADNKDLRERYESQIAKDPDYEFKGELAEYKAQWDELSQEEKRLAQIAKDTANEMDKKKAAAGISLMGATVTDDYDGDVAVKEAVVRVNDELYTFTLSKYNLVNQVNQSRPRSRWIISDIKKQGD